MTNTVRVATAIQAAALPVIFAALAKRSARSHAEDWADIAITVAKSSKDLGLDVAESAMPKRVVYDLCNTELVEEVFPKVAKALKKADGTEVTHAEFRKNMFELQSIIRTPKGSPMHQFRLGQFGDKKGRPALDAKPVVAKARKAKAAKPVTAKKARKAKAKVAA